MKVQNFQNIYQRIKPGTLHTIHTLKVLANGYSKETKMLVRFVNYYNVKAVKESGKTPSQGQPNPNIQVLIPHVLTFNQNTGNFLVHCYPVANHKAKSIYKDNQGNTIDKVAYELVNKPRPSSNGARIVFQVNVNDIVDIDNEDQ